MDGSSSSIPAKTPGTGSASVAFAIIPKQVKQKEFQTFAIPQRSSHIPPHISSAPPILPPILPNGACSEVHHSGWHHHKVREGEQCEKLAIKRSTMLWR